MSFFIITIDRQTKAYFPGKDECPIETVKYYFFIRDKNVDDSLYIFLFLLVEPCHSSQLECTAKSFGGNLLEYDKLTVHH